MSEECFSCGGVFASPSCDVTHAYMASTAGCWETYTALLAREYGNAVLFGRCHRLTVDAFAVQHPGNPEERRARQSFWIHGASLWLVLRMGCSHSEATAALPLLARGDFPLPPKTSGFAMTHADVIAADAAKHEELIRKWAEAALAGCPEAHATFELLARRVL